MNQENRPTELCVLKGARELISESSRWIQRELSRDARGLFVLPERPEAVCWCSVGALHKAQYDCNASADERVSAWNRLQDICGAMLAEFNDTHTHPQVLAIFDAAILAALSEHQTPSAKEGR